MLNAPLILTSSVLANSEYSANVLAESFPALRRKTTVIYNAVIGPQTAVPAREDIETALRVVFVGRLSPRKGVDVLVDAIAALRANGVDARLDIVGAVVPGKEGYQAQLERSIARYDLKEAVTFHGFDPNIWPHLAGADVAVVPSRSDEPFGNTAVEAILAARPLVVSDTSGLREAAAGYESAVFVEPGDPLQLAEALQRIRDTWNTYRTAAIEDAKSALTRNSTENYRNGLVSAVTGASKRSAFLG
jgi:glycosyltransferase involved in cell wall biosynthesis